MVLIIAIVVGCVLLGCMIGILSETSHATPTPRYYDPAELPDPLNPYGGRREASVATSRPSVWYPSPWQGGWSHFRDAVDYMITGSLAVLDIGSRRREEWLYNIYTMGRDAIDRLAVLWSYSTSRSCDRTAASLMRSP